MSVVAAGAVAGAGRSGRRKAAVGRANGVEGAGAGGRRRTGALSAGHGGALRQDIPQGGYESRVGAGRRRPHVGHPQALGGVRGLDVEVEDDLHVVGDEADRRHDDAGGRRHRHAVRETAGGEGLQMVVDIRLEPAGPGRAGARAEHEVVVGRRLQAETLGEDGQQNVDETAMLSHVGDLGRQVGGHTGVEGGGTGVGGASAVAGGRAPLHGFGNGVSDEREPDGPRVDAALTQPLVRLDDGVDVGPQHAVGVVEGAGLVDGEPHGRPARAADPGGGIDLGAPPGGPVGSSGEQLQRAGHVLAVLAASRVRAVCGGCDRQDAARPAVGQGAQGLGDEREPVAVADDHR